MSVVGSAESAGLRAGGQALEDSLLACIAVLYVLGNIIRGDSEYQRVFAPGKQVHENPGSKQRFPDQLN